MKLRFVNLFLTYTSLMSLAAIDVVAQPSKPYGLTDLSAKAVDNRGVTKVEGAPYGVRNFRVVLDGLVYRGGANNFFPNRAGDVKRNNHNPLKAEALQTLCENDFDTAVYLYGTNFASAPKNVTCDRGRRLTYLSLPPLDRNENVTKILRLIHERIVSENSKRIYLHCWNGWHASGFISALTLRQFCGLSADDAVAYWDRNTDGNNKASRYKKIREQIRSFKPDPALGLSADQKTRLCLLSVDAKGAAEAHRNSNRRKE